MTARLTAYLDELGLPQYRRLFESNQVTLPILRSLSEESLAVIGITNAEHRQSLVRGSTANRDASNVEESAKTDPKSEAIRYQTTIANTASGSESDDALKVLITNEYLKAGRSAFALKDVRAASVSSNEDWINSQNAKLERGSTMIRWIGLILLILDVIAIYYWQDIPEFFESLIDISVSSWVPPVLLTLIGLPMVSDSPMRLHEPSYSVEIVSIKEQNLLWTEDPDQADEIAVAINEAIA